MSLSCQHILSFSLCQSHSHILAPTCFFYYVLSLWCFAIIIFFFLSHTSYSHTCVCLLPFLGWGISKVSNPCHLAQRMKVRVYFEPFLTALHPFFTSSCPLIRTFVHGSTRCLLTGSETVVLIYQGVVTGYYTKYLFILCILAQTENFMFTLF